VAKRCELCWAWHESYQAHVFATNRKALATNRKKVEAVSLDVGKAEAVRQEKREDVAQSGDEEGGLGKTRNRRNREAYNAYQREYMRKLRNKKEKWNAEQSEQECPDGKSAGVEEGESL
jgi:hypothetical protein